MRKVNRAELRGAAAGEPERPGFEDVHLMPSALEGAAYLFAEDFELAHRTAELDARSKVVARLPYLAPLPGWSSQEVRLGWSFHEALNETTPAELAEGRRVLFEGLVGKLRRSELSAKCMLLRMDGPSLGGAVPVPPWIWEVCEIDWAVSEIAVPNGTRFLIVEIIETEPQAGSALQPQRSDPPAPTRGLGGRPVRHDWDAFWVEIAWYAASQGLGPVLRSGIPEVLRE